MEGTNPEEETSTNPNKLLLDAMMAQMMTTMNQQLESMRTDMERMVAERPRRNPLHTDTDEYYSNSFRRSNGSTRRRRDREERPPRPIDPLAGLKIRIPPFHGTSNPEDYLEWEKKIELVFNCREYTSENKVKVAPTEFKDYALSWWDQLVTSRRRAGDDPIETWNQMKTLMRKRFVPSHYHRTKGEKKKKTPPKRKSPIKGIGDDIDLNGR